MKTVILLVGVVTANKVGHACTILADCDTSRKGDNEEVC